MKYILYRSFGDLDKQVKKHALVAVEYGKDIYDVTEDLIRDVTEDLAEMPEYIGYDTTVFAPEPVYCTRRLEHYKYELWEKPYHPMAPKNILVDYGIIETTE